MALSLHPRHLVRYKDIARLLVAHARSEGVRDYDPDDPVTAEPTEQDAEKLVEDLESMGPTFVKLGQLLSTRADLLPPVYVTALARLQDGVEAVPFDAIEDVVTTELGARISKAFSVFDERPLASASLGQVYRAAMRDGRPVAVKVQRPGVKRQVIEDMEVIEELAAFVDGHTKLGRNYGFSGMAAEFRRSIMAELDYRIEASNLEILGKNLAGYEHIVVPQPVDDFTTARVLTMDLVEGTNVGALGPLARLELDGGPLAGELFDAYLDQILVHGFVHADPHPGNVLLTDDGRLALIDLGMVTQLSPQLQDALVRLLLSVSAGDGEAVADVMAGLGDRRDTWDPNRFSREVAVLVQKNHAATMRRLKAGRLVGELAHIAGDCGLRPPPELTMLGKTLLNLDDVARTLDPDFDPNAAIQAHVADIMRHKALQSAAPSNVLAAALDAKEFVEKLPGRINKLMDGLADGELTVNVNAIDEKELMRGIQKLANRVTTGVIIAALIVGAAMLMRVETQSKLFGYPSLAIVCFLGAAVAGLILIVKSLLNDLPQRRRHK